MFQPSNFATANVWHTMTIIILEKDYGTTVTLYIDGAFVADKMLNGTNYSIEKISYINFNWWKSSIAANYFDNVSCRKVNSAEVGLFD